MLKGIIIVLTTYPFFLTMQVVVDNKFGWLIADAFGKEPPSRSHEK